MNILYKPVLNLELWHDYYLEQLNPPILPKTGYDISETLILIPTSDCEQVLKKLRWVFRPQPWGATIFAHVRKVESDDGRTDFQTIVPLDRPYRLTFWLVVRNSYFANFTNLPLTPSRDQIYYFSNLADNQGHALFLTQPLPVYTPGTAYSLGQVVTYQDNALQNQTLEALKYIPSADPIPGEDDWNFLPVDSQYVSALDSLPRQGLSRPYIVSSVNPGEIVRFSLVNLHGQESFAIEITVPENHPPGDPIMGNLNFIGQQPGRYQLFRNNTRLDEFVLVDPFANQNAFALVEILLDQDQVSPAFSLLELIDGQTYIRPKTYLIRYLNRATHWRYRYEKPHGFCLQDQAPNDCKEIDPRFVVIDKNSYVTKRPIGLLHKPKKLLNDGKRVLPAPSATLIKPTLEPATDAGPDHISNIFSDVYL
jgi:hypothetical protein